MENKFFLFSSKNTELESLFTLNGGLITYDPLNLFDVVVFTPGEDITPFMYGEKKLKRSLSNFNRDMRENALYRSLPTKVPKIGIGRGAQFLNIMAGGRLYQHVSGHTSPHTVIDLLSGNEMQVTSFHHQEMILPDDADLLVMANAADKKETPSGIISFDIPSNIKSKQYNDTEVGYIERTTSLLFQPRPEKEPNTVWGKNTKNLFFQYYEDWVKPSIKNSVRINA